MRSLTKFLLIIILIIVFVFNYRILTAKGLVKINEQFNSSLFSVQSVEYYNNPLKGTSNDMPTYIVIVHTDQYDYLTGAEQEDITVIRGLDYLAGSNAVKNITPWHWAFFIGAFLIILLFPHKRKAN